MLRWPSCRFGSVGRRWCFLIPGARAFTCATYSTVAVKRNLTIQLDDDLIRRAKVIAAERGTSVSGLVAQQITELIAARDRYVRARESALQMMSEATDRGGRRWTREELYEERISRYGA